MQEKKLPLPPFTKETATQKVRMAENGWNMKNPSKIAQAYSINSRWRNRDLFIQGREKIEAFLINKYAKELDYRLCKELWAFTEDKIAVRFAYEWHDESGQWYRSYGNENWEFDENGLMKVRLASINDLAIEQSQRKLTWDGDVRPDDFASLSEMGL